MHKLREGPGPSGGMHTLAIRRRGSSKALASFSLARERMHIAAGPTSRRLRLKTRSERADC